MKNCKRCISFILSFSLVLAFFSTITSTSAAEKQENEYYTSKEANKIEEKPNISYSINDEFAVDSFMVVLKNEESLKFNDYTIKDFIDIDLKSVSYINKYTYNCERDLYQCQIARNKLMEKIYDESFKVSELTSLVNSDSVVNSLITSANENPIINDRLLKNKCISSLDNYIASLKENYTYLNEIDFNNYHTKLKFKLNTKTKQEVLNSIDKLNKYDNVLYAIPNFYSSFDSLEDDYEPVSGLWYLQDINYFSSLSYLDDCQSVNVAVMDSGIESSHPYLQNHLNYELSQSFIDSSNDPFIDLYDHGTCVAGIIAGDLNNTEGTVGICPNVNVISLRVGEYNAELIAVTEAMDYVRQNSSEIDIVNMSFQLPYAAYNEELLNQCTNEANEIFSGYNGTIICAAGNEGTNLDNSNIAYFPSRLDNVNVICVANSQSNHQLNNTSNYGCVSVDLAAPGTNIKTTSNDGGYRLFTGSSASAPIVTGVVAIIKSLHPYIAPSQIRQFLIENVTSYSNLNSILSQGVVNLNNTLTDIYSKHFTINYLSNGGNGDTMDSTIVYYGVNNKLNENTYYKLDYRFTGWTAYRYSDNKWLYTDQNGNNHWYVEGQQPSNYVKFKYNDGVYVAKTSSVNNDTVDMIAQWEPLSIGDINLDGIININDVTLLQRYLSGSVTLNEQQLRLSDVNGDGRITISDVTRLQIIISQSGVV